MESEKIQYLQRPLLDRLLTVVAFVQYRAWILTIDSFMMNLSKQLYLSNIIARIIILI